MDIIDHATDIAEAERQRAISQRPRAPVIAATGSCLCCDHPLPPERRWCDADCRDEWQKRTRR